MKTILGATLASSALAGNWTTSNNKLFYKGTETVLHGFSTTCTEYLLRGVGLKCWPEYNWSDYSNIITGLDIDQVSHVKFYFAKITADGIKPMLRVPMTASNWLGVETNAAKDNMAKYPNLSEQYQTMISKIVDEFTGMGAVVILDLQWSDDDTEQTNMPLKNKAGTGGALEFWSSVSDKFKDNDHVFYELFNEPFSNTTDRWLNGDGTYAGVLDMISTIRQNSPDQMLVVAGANSYAYDADSLVELEGKITDDLVMYNFHPYMGPNQAGDTRKNADGFEAMVQ